jgi:FkbM family methyltransferase
VGAHVGFFTLLAAVANPGARVVALEPLPAVFERLTRNIRLNHLDNVVAFQCAAGADDGLADFSHVGGIIPCSSSLSRAFMDGAPNLRAVPVEVTRIDTFMDQQGLSELDLIKLDTETTEADVIIGMGEALRRSLPDIICEVLPQGGAAVLNELLSPLGYHFFSLTDSGPRPRSLIEPDEVWRNWLFSITSPPSW